MVKINVSQLKTGIGKKSKKDLVSNYLTTMGFYRMTPIFYHHMTPLENIRGSHKIFSRLSPLVHPAMVEANYHINNFFVRYKDVWPVWDAFKNHVVFNFSDGVNKIPINCPYVYEEDIVDMFINGSNDLADVVSPNSDWDFAVYDDETAAYVNYYQFTLKGADMYKMLCNLGYRINWRYTGKNGVKVKINMLPILCYVKCYADWFYPSQYVHGTTFYEQLATVFNNTTSDDYSMYRTFLENVLLWGLVPFYNDDRFCVCWENPNAPADSNAELFVHNEGPLPEVITNPSLYDYVPVHNVGSGFTKLGVEWLFKFSNFIKKHQLVGSRIAERFLSEYGVPLKDTHKAQHLGRSVVPIKIGDVESNANSSNGSEVGVVGDLSGKGVALQSGLDFSYSSDTFDGMFLTILSCIANSHFGMGMDRHNVHHYAKDFYTAQFDSLGTAGVMQREVNTGFDGGHNNSPVGIFGYLPRYYEYVMSKSILSGNFVYRSLGRDDLSGYHLFRTYGNDGYQNTLQASLGFLSPTENDRNELNRIFYAGYGVDQFIVKFDTEFESYGPKKQLKDNYDFFGEDDHKTVEVENNGVHVN